MTEIVTLPQLTSEEDTFALAIIEYGGNLAAAYRSVFAGEDEKIPNAAAKARELLSKPHIAKRIHQLTLAVEEHALISLGSHLVKLAEIRDISIHTGNLKIALGAEVKRGEAAGFYANKIAQKPGEGGPMVQVTINAPAGSIADWGAKHGKMPVVVDAVVKS